MRGTGPLRILVRCLALLGMVLAGAGCSSTLPPSSQPGPIDLDEEPFQQEFSGSQTFMLSSEYGDFMLVPRAWFRISAQVISTRWYRSGWEASLSPLDLALVWGQMARGDRVGALSFFHEHRGYSYELGRLAGIDSAYAAAHIANIHLIFASRAIRRGIKTIRPMDRVRLEGLLVDVYGQGSGSEYVWKSSVSRTDRGSGACELLFLQRAQVNGQTFP